MGYVDSQIHLFSPDSAAYAASVHQVMMPPEAVIQAMDGAGVERALLVPAGGSVANEVCLDAAAKWPERFRVMGRISLNKPDGRERMANWQASGFAGVRLAFYPQVANNWLVDGTADWFWPEADRCGIALMIWAPGQLHEIGKLAARFPRIRFIIDHFGLHVSDRGEAVAPVIEALVQLAPHRNVAVKASALPHHSTQAFPFRDLHEPIRRVVEAFGSKRVMWGTDLTRQSFRYDEAIRLFTQELGFLDASQIEDIMGGTATRWIPWEAHHG